MIMVCSLPDIFVVTDKNQVITCSFNNGDEISTDLEKMDTKNEEIRGFDTVTFNNM